MDFSNPAIPVRDGEELDVARVEAFLKERLPGLSGKPQILQFPSGKSNLTYLVIFPNRELVLRRPPFGTKAKSAHDMSREYRVLSGLKQCYPHVPQVSLFCEDESVIGSQFYVMERVVGSLIHQDIPMQWNFSRADTRKLCLNFWDGLIQLHQTDYRTIGLENLGKPIGYAKRQILGWNKRYVNALTPDAPPCVKVRAWLEDRIPKESGACVIHNDYRIDNIILRPDNPLEIAAVLDWEMATLGDPLMDLGNSMAYWVQADDPDEVQAGRSQPSNADGMLTRDEVIRYFADKTGLDVSKFGFYRVYGLFRLAVIIQQLYYRFYHGQSSDPRFAGLVHEVSRLEKRCLEVMEAESE